MRKLLLRYFVPATLILILSIKCFSQFDSLDNIFYLKQLLPQGILLDKGWKFQAGDNPEFAKPDYNDSKWQPINPTLDIHDLPQVTKPGIGWLRLHLLIDSNLLKEQLALMIHQSGASEIYLNGRLLYRFGTVSTDPNEVKAYDPVDKPVSILFDTSITDVLAVRFTLEPHLLYTTEFARTNPLLEIGINQTNRFFEQYLHHVGQDLDFFRIGVFFILTILHLAFFLYYPIQKANLYFCFYSFFLTLFGLCQPGVFHEVKYIFYVSNFALGLRQLGTFFLLTALYSLLNQRRGLIYWGLLAATIAGIFLNSWGYFRVSVFLIGTLINIEMVRISFKALKLKKRGAWILVAGSLNFSIFWIAFILANIFNYLDVPVISTFTIFNLTYNVSALSIPVATSIYLGLDFAFTSRSLQQKLTEVEQLSNEKQEILISQKEALEKQVTERTTELKQSLEELKSTQAQLIQSEKMASLGELTAGIAHEIQNPLNFVNNFSDVNRELIAEMKDEIIKGNLDEVKFIADDLDANEEKINHHGKRADAIVKGMLQHSRTSTGKKEPTDINALADEYLRLSYHGIRAKDKNFNAELKTNFDESIGKINVVPQDIGRVLLNLFNNAFYAVMEKSKNPEGFANPRGLEAYQATVSVSTKKIDDKVLISVKDNGVGIPQKIADKIFQPFFTTKPTGQGTGLGLSLSYDIIKAHGGEIKVETREGEGSEFIIQLFIV